jgi:hypothetical protein
MVDRYRVAGAFEACLFLLEHDVLAARLFIAVVY